MVNVKDMQTVANGSPNAAGWEQVFATRPWGRYPPEALVRFISRRFNGVEDRAGVRILEVGCGPGANLWYLAREGFSASGIDFSPTALAQARDRIDREGLGDRLELQQGDFAALPWPDNHFDLVIDVEAMSANDCSTINAVLAEVRRVLRPGGAFFGIMFGQETTGYDKSSETESGTMTDPQAGPCQGQTFAHFFEEEELGRLFNDFDCLRLDWTKRSDRCGQLVVAEWLVSAEKPAAR